MVTKIEAEKNMAQNLIEKIAQKYALNINPKMEVKSGNFIAIRPEHVMTHDNTGAVIPKFKSIGATKLHNPRQVVHTLDHNIQDKSEKNLNKYAKIEAFSKAMGCDFYPAGRGIGHQILIEEGYAFPGTMIVASDSHSNMHGGVGALGTPIVRTDAAAIWATGQTWWQIPPVAKVILKGKLREGVTGKDVIIALAGFFNNDQVLNHAIEFAGEGVSELSIEQRLSISNMTTEWGALAGVFPIDDVTLKWLKRRIDYLKNRPLAGVPSDADGNGQHPRLNENRLQALTAKPPEADAEAFYAKEITLNLNEVVPYISGPHNVKTMNAASDMEAKNITIHKAYLLSCVNSREEDIAQAAKIMQGKKIADGVQFYIAAASSEVQQESERQGHWQILLEAGAIELPPGCGPCIGLGTGLLEDGEVGISATNRNFKGRMGSPLSEAYLASPAVVAASAIAGKITSPFSIEKKTLNAAITENKNIKPSTARVEIIDGFPRQITGEIVWCHQNNMNTDGIYPGKYTYEDDITPEKQADVVMENYDPEFTKIVDKGDILVGGYNFGTGSSREQAATALKYRGIALAFAGSFSETYKRNAINNGFLVLEAPELVKDLQNVFGQKSLTLKTAWQATIDFKKAELTINHKTYPLSPVGKAAQELVVEGGLENWVKNRL
jgi:homoaconitate hydratase